LPKHVMRCVPRKPRSLPRPKSGSWRASRSALPAGGSWEAPGRRRWRVLPMHNRRPAPPRYGTGSVPRAGPDRWQQSLCGCGRRSRGNRSQAVSLHIGRRDRIADAVISLRAARALAFTRNALVEASLRDIGAGPRHVEGDKPLLVGPFFLRPSGLRHQRHLGLGFRLVLEEELELTGLTGRHQIESELRPLLRKTGDQTRCRTEPVGGILVPLLPDVERVARFFGHDAVAGGRLERQRETVCGLSRIGFLLASRRYQRRLRLDELVEQPGRRLAQIVAELAEADRRIAAVGLLDPDLMSLRGRGQAQQGGEGGAE